MTNNEPSDSASKVRNEDPASENPEMLIPEEYQSGDPSRPLKYTDDKGFEYTYYLDPMWKATIFILLLEGMERFAYYVLQPEFYTFLTNPAFAGMTQADAAALVSVFGGISYVWPLIGGAVGDALTGQYKGILIFSSVYLIALVLVALMGSVNIYEDWMLPVFFYFLMPMGMGGVKSLISVMGANQFHPELHKSEVTSYYMKFYMTINVCAALSTAVNVYVNTVGDDLWKAFMIPAIVFGFGIVVYIAFQKRYVKRRPLGSVVVQVLKVGGRAMKSCPPSMNNQRESRGGKVQDSFVDDTWKMLSLIPFLFMAHFFFMMTYYQQANYLIYQGFEMNPTGGIESNVLNSAINPVCIVGFGFLLDTWILPALRKRNMEPNHINKIIIGCFCGTLAMLWQVLLESLLKNGWNEDRSQVISILAQVPCYALIGLGEILVNPTGYDLAYKIAPQSFKGLAMGLSAFMVGSIPSFVAGALAKSTHAWQSDINGCSSRNDDTCNTTLVDPITGDPVWDYTTTNIQNLYWIGVGFSVTGMIVLHFLGKPLYRKFFIESDSYI